MHAPLPVVFLAAGLPVRPQPPKIPTHTCPNGLTVLVAENHAVPLISWATRSYRGLSSASASRLPLGRRCRVDRRESASASTIEVTECGCHRRTAETGPQGSRCPPRRAVRSRQHASPQLAALLHVRQAELDDDLQAARERVVEIGLQIRREDRDAGMALDQRANHTAPSGGSGDRQRQLAPVGAHRRGFDAAEVALAAAAEAPPRRC